MDRKTKGEVRVTEQEETKCIETGQKKISQTHWNRKHREQTDGVDSQPSEQENWNPLIKSPADWLQAAEEEHLRWSQ